MDVSRWKAERIFVYRYPVDMRKAIDGLSTLVATELGRNPADRCIYVFTNRGRDKVKLLIWHLNGYWLLYKRVEKQRFK
jgi:transposase